MMIEQHAPTYLSKNKYITPLGLVTNINGFMLTYARPVRTKPGRMCRSVAPYSHQTWRDGDLPWDASTHEVTCSFDHVVLQNHVTN